MESKFELARDKALEVIKWFPLSKNWYHYLSLSDGRKVFFSIFIKKYGLDDTKNKYCASDVLRRIRVIEFFDYMIKDNKVINYEHENSLVESKFWRMVIGHIGKPGKERLEMISFYHYL
jgi:hypothetical protein